MKTFAEIEQLLSIPCSEEVTKSDYNGYRYLPWNESVKIANSIFGATAWNSEITDFAEVQGAGFRCSVRVTVQVLSDAGAVITFSHDGEGFADIKTTKSGEPLLDTAVKAAESDATSRAFKKFGAAFGLHFYDKEDEPENKPTRQPVANRRPVATSTPQRVPVGSGSGKRGTPTEQMVKSLQYRNVPANIIGELSFETASAMIGALKAGARLDDVLAEHGYETVAY